MVLIIFNLKVYYNTIYRCLNHGYTKLTAVLFYYYNMNVIAISLTSSIEMGKSLLLYGSITQQSNPKATIKSKNCLYYIGISPNQARQAGGHFNFRVVFAVY